MTEVNNGTASLEPAYNIISRTFMVPTPPNKSVDRKGDRIKRNIWRSR